MNIEKIIAIENIILTDIIQMDRDDITEEYLAEVHTALGKIIKVVEGK